MTSKTSNWQRACHALIASALITTATLAAFTAPTASAATTPSASAGASGPVLEAKTDPLYSWVPWTEADLASVTVNTSAADPLKATSRLLDGKPATTVIIKKLQDGLATLAFKQPRKIRQLAFVQSATNDWALPLKLQLRLDGKDTLEIALQNAPGKIQSIPFNRTLTQLEIRILGIHNDAQRKHPWGGFPDIGESLYGAAEWSFLDTPLQDHQRDLRITVETPVATTATASFKIGQKRRFMRFDLPPLPLRAGKHTYTLSLDALKPAENYGYDIRPRHLETLVLNGPDGNIPVRLDALEPLQAPTTQDHWEPLPPLSFPTRQINGKTWTEGHSHRTTGRFANSTYNGLVNEVVSGNWIRAYTANGDSIHRRQDFDFSIEGQQDDTTDSTGELWRLKRSAWNPDTEKVTANWTTMILERRGHDNATTRILTGLLAPGFLIDAPKNLTLSSRGGGKLPVRSGAPDEDEARFMKPDTTKSGKPMIGPSAVLTSTGLLTQPQTIRNLREPWIVAIWGIRGDEPTFWGDKAVALLLTADTHAPIEWTPSGLRLPPTRWGLSTAFHGLLNEGWETSTVSERARQLTRMLRTYPVDCREYYLVEDDTVRIRNEFRYERWGSPAWQTTDYAPIPPIYNWARDSIAWHGIPAGSPTSIKASIKTPIGPFRWNDGATLDYTLPRIPARHAAAPRRDAFASTYKAMADGIAAKMGATAPLVSHPSNHPWLVAYRDAWTQGLIGGSFHEPAARQTLIDFARPNVERMYAPSSWILRRELFTKEPYQIRGWLDISTLPGMFGDPNSNVGQAAYSTYLYALYSGDWDTIRRLWPRIMDTLRIFEVLNDWAIPGTTSREAVKYGSIDMDTIAYAGVAAMHRMAQVLGQTEDANRIAYLQTKIAAATALRFNFPRYLDPENKHPRLYGVGFAEDGPAIERAAPKNTIGLDHIAMCLTWTGEMPEMYDFYLNILGTDFFTRFQRDFMDKQFSGWREMAYNQSRSAAHIANRAWLPDWPADGLKSDLDTWLAHTKQTTPPYRTSGMFGAYTAHETGVWLIGWEPARFVNSRYDHATRLLSLELENAQPFELEVHSPALITELKIDGRSQTLEKIRSENNRHTLPLSHGGKIEIHFATTPH
ncbi:hypothetical protein [Geminisphaera colitermitum]|uniref:hypothetical protein n=1 Tax=Geminisphaera colitermitum TaxID=1148786 RepID=UPI0005BAB890|nr:hypothetical protein [Geminisphaera colitermitum]